MRQIVLNLLSNAIKFTPPGGEIAVKVGWTSSGGQYLSVKDTGPGIPEDEIPIVMSSFGRGSLAIKTAEQGSGLGLPIVKGLVDLHGGGFQLKSKPREGTEVIVTFPAARVMDALPAVEARRQRGGRGRPRTGRIRPATPACSNVAMPRWQATAALIRPTASAAPVPSPSRIPRASSGILPRRSSTA